jgi:hypothetical protein
MAQVTVKGLNVIKDIENQAKDAVNEELERYFTVMANDAVDMASKGVWSGAYVKSFSFKAGNSSSRGRRVDGANWKFKEPTGTAADVEAGRSMLLGDIRSAFDNNDPLETKSYTIRNDANHARFVEYGVNGGAHPPGPRPRDGYRIFTILRSRYG